MAFIDILVNLVVAIIMLTIGVSIRIRELKSVFLFPQSLVLGLFLQIVFLPLLTFLVISLGSLNPYFALGLFILALCPGGTTSNFITYLVGANIALSILMTLINSFLITFTIPFFYNFVFDFFLDQDQTIYLPFNGTALHIFKVIFIPMFIGISLRAINGSFPEKIMKTLKVMNTALLAFIFGIKIFFPSQKDGVSLSLEDILMIAPYALFIHFISVFFSFLLARKIRLNKKDAITIGIEVGLQNTALAILITETIIKQHEMTKPALVYAGFSFFTTLIFALITGYDKAKLL